MHSVNLLMCDIITKILLASETSHKKGGLSESQSQVLEELKNKLL